MPARREIRSARSALSVLAEDVAPRPVWPAVPSLIATTESADIEVVAEFGVPGPMSLGVAGSEGGGGTVQRVSVPNLQRASTCVHTIDQGRASTSHDSRFWVV